MLKNCRLRGVSLFPFQSRVDWRVPIFLDGPPLWRPILPHPYLPLAASVWSHVTFPRVTWFSPPLACSCSLYLTIPKQKKIVHSLSHFKWLVYRLEEISYLHEWFEEVNWVLVKVLLSRLPVGSYSIKFCTGRLRSQVQTFTLKYTNFYQNGTPFT